MIFNVLDYSKGCPKKTLNLRQKIYFAIFFFIFFSNKNVIGLNSVDFNIIFFLLKILFL